MANPINQHWVPRFYLRYFATPETRDSAKPCAWIFSKECGDPTVTTLRNIAAWRYLYSPLDRAGNRSWKVEQRLAEVESLMAGLWPVLTTELVDLHGNESIRKGLALFIALLHLRHPRRLAETERVHTQLVEMNEALPKDEHGRPALGSIEYKGVVRPFDNSNWEEYRDASPEEHKVMFLDALTRNAIDCAEILMKKRWSVVFADDPVFITTDTPVTLFHETRKVFGLATPGTYISFPLSPTRVLMMDDRHAEPQGHY